MIAHELSSLSDSLTRIDFQNLYSLFRIDVMILIFNFNHCFWEYYIVKCLL